MWIPRGDPPSEDVLKSEQFYPVQRWKLLLEKQDELSSQVTFKGTLNIRIRISVYSQYLLKELNSFSVVNFFYIYLHATVNI